jgi:hypothetical protein
MPLVALKMPLLPVLPMGLLGGLWLNVNFGISTFWVKAFCILFEVKR